MRCSDEAGCPARLAEGLPASGARSLTGVVLPTVFAGGLACFVDAGLGDALFTVFLPVDLAVLVMNALFRFLLAFALAFLPIAITASWTINSILNARSLPNKTVSQRVPS
jgi:hypothetical protein